MRADYNHTFSGWGDPLIGCKWDKINSTDRHGIDTWPVIWAIKQALAEKYEALKNIGVNINHYGAYKGLGSRVDELQRGDDIINLHYSFYSRLRDELVRLMTNHFSSPKKIEAAKISPPILLDIYNPYDISSFLCWSNIDEIVADVNDGDDANSANFFKADFSKSPLIRPRWFVHIRRALDLMTIPSYVSSCLEAVPSDFQEKSKSKVFYSDDSDVARSMASAWLSGQSVININHPAARSYSWAHLNGPGINYNPDIDGDYWFEASFRSGYLPLTFTLFSNHLSQCDIMFSVDGVVKAAIPISSFDSFRTGLVAAAIPLLTNYGEATATSEVEVKYWIDPTKAAFNFKFKNNGE